MRKNKIRILHVAQAAGGVDRYIRMLLKYLDKEKFENILVCSQDFHEEDYRDLVDSFEQVEMTRAIGGNDLKAIKEVRTLIKKYNPDIVYVPSRNNSRVARAPQSFWLDDILSAHEKMLTKGITNCIDSCTMMQECGFNLHLVDGPGENIKITTPEDFYTMRAILEAKENAQIYGFDE